jgi:biopolymer transport protein ExbD
MKISGAKQVHYESGPNMTPLVDVVMVILIFLMLAGSFGTGEKYMVGSTQLKSKGAGGPVPKDWVPPVTIEISVNDRGGVRVPWNPAVAITDNDQLTAALAKQLDVVVQQNAGVGVKASTVELILRPDASTEWEKLAPVYAAALRAKFEKIGFAPAR